MQLPHSISSRSQHQLFPVFEQQRQLPSLQDIIKPETDISTDRKTRHEDDWHYQHTFVVCRSQSSSPIKTSPLQPPCTSIPSLSSSYQELNLSNYNDEMLSQSGGWGSASQYSNGPASYASSTSSSQGYYSRAPLPLGRSQQNLPSLTEMNLAQSTPTYGSRPSQLNRQPYYCTSPTEPLEISYGKTNQNDFGASIYNQTPRTPYNIATNDYSSSVYDPYCYPNGTSWPPSLQCGSGYVGSDTASIGSTRRRRGNLPKHVTDILKSWFADHVEHPYPTDEDKQMLMAKTNLTIQQISNWFINARRRHWPSMKEVRSQQRKPLGRHL